MSDTIHSGGCQCGAVRFEAKGDPRFVANCHCQSCRRASGAAISTWVGYLDDKWEWKKGAPSLYKSSDGVERGFCSVCGTPISYAGVRFPGEIHFMVGAFDDADFYTPTRDAHPGEKLHWAPLIDAAK